MRCNPVKSKKNVFAFFSKCRSFDLRFFTSNFLGRLIWNKVLYIDRVRLKPYKKLKVNNFSFYCKYYSQSIVVFLVSNGQVDSKLLTDY